MQVGTRLSRVEPRGACRRWGGMRAGLPRVNCWTIAEHASHSRPIQLQHLLAAAVWDADGVLDDLSTSCAARASHTWWGPKPAEEVLVVDETGDLKKGSDTVGGRRHYTGTAGWVENSQVAVYLAYAGPFGQALIDLELYLPHSWTDDPQRCADAGVPVAVQFASKSALAKARLQRCVDAGVQARRVAGDEIHGADLSMRAWCRQHTLGLRTGRGPLPPDRHRNRTAPRGRPGRADRPTLVAHQCRRRSQGPPTV